MDERRSTRSRAVVAGECVMGDGIHGDSSGKAVRVCAEFYAKHPSMAKG